MRTVKRFLISGRVQGVGFRYFVQSAAVGEAIRGWVRNLDDGRVEAAAAGDSDAMARFEDALRHGPPGARVDHVEVDETFPLSTKDTMLGFHIR